LISGIQTNIQPAVAKFCLFIVNIVLSFVSICFSGLQVPKSSPCHGLSVLKYSIEKWLVRSVRTESRHGRACWGAGASGNRGSREST
jgi:hypothetical protein